MADTSNSGNDTSFITIVFLSMIFFGLAVKTTIFSFPSFGEEIYETIIFYSQAITLAVAGITLKFMYRIYKHKQIPELPNVNVPWWKVIIRFAIAYPICYIAISLFFKQTIMIPASFDYAFRIITQETIVSNLENILLFILLTALMLANTNIGGHLNLFGFKVPNLARIIAHIPPVLFMTGLHTGRYSELTGSVPSLIIALAINFFLFMFMFVLFDTFGYGVAEGWHAAWNTALMFITGSVI